MRLTALLPVFALTAGATAQLTQIPSATVTTRPTLSPFYINSVFYGTSSTTTQCASHSQTIVDCADISAPVAVWNSLEVRRPVGLGNQNPAWSTNATIMMSVSTASWQASTNNFLNNQGASPTTVFSGMLSLPAAINQATWPAPWQPPIPFSTPFVYAGQAGGSLVLDIHQDAGLGNAAMMQGWYLEYTTPNIGGRAENGGPQSTCRFSGGTYNSGLGYTTAGLGGNGGPWYVNYSSLQAGLIGIGVIGFNGHGGFWNGIPLSIDLGPIGAPGCRWSVSMEIIVPLATGTATSAQWPTQTIPADPSLRGNAFYDHSLWIDPLANAAGIVTGWSSKWNIGTQIGAPAAFVAAVGNAHNNATGTRTAGGCPTFQLQ